MNGDYNDNKKHSVPDSFRYAVEGLVFAIRHERNMKIHLAFATIVFGCSFYFQIQKWEWITVILLIGGMLSFELVNTAIEQVVNFISPEKHPVAKVIKDIAAGAVFMYAVTSAIAGIIIFYPYIFS